jgi:membrane protein DedA with SNARE-associated domain
MGDLAEQLIDLLLGLPSSTIYLLVALLCWAEAAFFLGFVTPGELAVATGGILASRGQVAVGWLVLVVVMGTWAGNSTGYWLGRRWGTDVLEWRPLERFFGGAIGKARDFMLRRGEWAIVLGRLATPTRIAVPFLAGASRVPYRRYLLFDVPATIAWAVAWVLLGFVLGESWERLEEVAGTAAIFVLILFVTALVIRWITTRVARNQRRMQALGRWFLTVTGTRGLALRLAPAFVWLGRRFDPRLAQGLNLTVAFLALVAAVAGVGLVLSQTQAVRGLVLFDFPVLEWMVARRTDEAVHLARSILLYFRWPGVLWVALPLALLAAWRVGLAAGFRVLLGVAGGGGGAYFLDMFVLEGVVPRAEFPSVPVAVAAAILTHSTAMVARRWGWGPGVGTAGAGTFLVCAVALGTVVAGWAAPSGIVLGFALGLGWATVVELPRTLLAGGESAPTSPAGVPGPGGGGPDSQPGTQ